MSIGALITLIVAIVVIAAIALLVVRRRSGGGHHLRRRFGPEYERAVARHGGDTRAAEDDLRELLRKHGDFKPLPLPTEARREFSGQWDTLQERFVDKPVESVLGAEQLINRLVQERGYPVTGHDDQVEVLSVHHPHHVGGYRRVHDLTQRLRAGSAPVGGGHPGTRREPDPAGAPDTEELRETFVRARVFFDELLTTEPDHGAAHHHGPWRRAPGGAGPRTGAPWTGGRHGGGRPAGGTARAAGRGPGAPGAARGL